MLNVKIKCEGVTQEEGLIYARHIVRNGRTEDDGEKYPARTLFEKARVEVTVKQTRGYETFTVRNLNGSVDE